MKKLRHIFENSPSEGYRFFLLLILFVSLYLAYLVIRPFLHSIVLAILLASVFYPLHVRLTNLYRGRRSAAALTGVGIVTFLIVIPILLFAAALVGQGVESINRINDWISAGNLQKLLQDPRIASYTAWLKDQLAFVDFSKIDLQDSLLQASKKTGQFLLSHGAGVLGDAANLVFYFLVMIFLLFYLLRDGSRMLSAIKELSPLPEDQENRILDKVRAVGRSAFLGNLLTALCQGFAGGIGLALVGIPGLFWGTVMGFSSLIPVVGTALIWIPAIGYLLAFGRWKAAIFLALWSIFLVGSIDNFLRPYLMRGEGKMSPFYLFLAIIGGVKYFGFAGILYGPLILGFAAVMLSIYQAEYSGKASAQ